MGRSWLVALLAVALAFGFGVAQHTVRADGPTLTVRGVVAGIAADDAAASSPTAGVSAGHLLLDDSSGTGAGVWVYGDVTNGSTGSVGNIQVTVTAFDANGAILATKSANPLVTALAVGSSAPFRMRMPAFSGTVARLAAVVDAFDPATAPPPVALSLVGPREVPVGAPDKTTHVQPISPDLYGIDGTIWNNSDATVEVNGAAVAIYDGNGNVALVATAGPIAASDGSSPPVLKPGMSATYTVYIQRAAYLAAAGQAKLVAFADITTVSSGTP